MAEQSGDKTQDPTPHRRQQAREQGQVAFSQDLGSAAVLVVGILLLKWWGLAVLEAAARVMRYQLGTVTTLAPERGDVLVEGFAIMQTIGLAMLPILGLLALAGVLSSVFQIGFLFVPERLSPDLSRLSPLGGLKRIFSMSGLMRLSFGMFKVAIVSVVAAAVLYQKSDRVLMASSLSVSQLGVLIADTALTTALWVGVALFLLALGDFAFQKWKHEQDLKMTHQEVQDEMKNLQGDPQVIARRKAVQRQLALNRMGDAVPRADVVVTNPTELAVAIQYDHDKMNAPIVVAKGAGLVAQRIRRIALEHSVPVVERKPLAQLLYKQVEINQPVPDESYAAVAEVLAYVYQLKGKKPPQPRQSA